MTHIPTKIDKALSQVASFGATLSPEASFYWERHRRRYRHMAGVVARLGESTRFERVLDVGMGFEVPVLCKLLPNARIDCLGVYEDSRFCPDRPFSFYNVDLNEPTQAAGAVGGKFDLIAFMEVLEHLYTPPDLVLRFLGSLLADRGMLILSTPNAVWLKNRLKMVRGKNPFALLSYDKKNMDHIREYTRTELEEYIRKAGLHCLSFETRGLYDFDNFKDNVYSAIADVTLPSLRRTLFCVCSKSAP